MDLRRSFWQGFHCKQGYNYGLVRSREEGEESMNQDTATFYGETLRGYISYSVLINPVPKLKGELKGLIVRYNPLPLRLQLVEREPAVR